MLSLSLGNKICHRMGLKRDSLSFLEVGQLRVWVMGNQICIFDALLPNKLTAESLLLVPLLTTHQERPLRVVTNPTRIGLNIKGSLWAQSLETLRGRCPA